MKTSSFGCGAYKAWIALKIKGERRFKGLLPASILDEF
jgi:hypothetical protein